MLKGENNEGYVAIIEGLCFYTDDPFYSKPHGCSIPGKYGFLYGYENPSKGYTEQHTAECYGFSKNISLVEVFTPELINQRIEELIPSTLLLLLIK